MAESEYKNLHINREISWLSFNARVLQEANDPTVPLMERIKFMAIFSSNLDEFFRVRVATLKRLVQLGKKSKLLVDDDPKGTLNQIQKIVTQQQTQFEEYYKAILKELKRKHIAIINEKQMTEEQKTYIASYFQEKVRPAIVPLMAAQLPRFPILDETSVYLAVRLEITGGTQASEYALVEVPLGELSRFVKLPAPEGNTAVMLLEELVRIQLPEIFSILNMELKEAFPIKITKDAELDIEDNVTKSFVETISKSVKLRIKGQPVRLTYDWEMSPDVLKFFTNRLGLSEHDTLLPERRYLNFKDFMKFPKMGAATLQYAPCPPLAHKAIQPGRSLLNTIREKDMLLHYPYQSFNYMIDLLREAAIDPKVSSIRMTLYRVADKSKIVNALSHAVKNGKSVTVLFEFRARFDEEANIYWANQLIEDGARVIYGIPDLKVHAKLCLITRRERGQKTYYATIGTGNFNEDTARLYGDHTLFTADKRLTTEVKSVFAFLKTNYKLSNYKHLLVSPFYMRDRWKELIHQEMKNAKNGKEAFIKVKLNSLMDRDMVETLYKASQAGVKIRLIVRGICSLVPGVKGLSEQIKAISIIDKYLEHSRIFIFCNNGQPKYYIGSADWMTRNLDHRVEVACPIYDADIQRELQRYFDIQWSDNVKARILNEAQDNSYRNVSKKAKLVRTQEAIYDFLNAELNES
ncbi:polyphosphate kinase 1 [candidate division KSB3 bacterium]|uniref:Polyphosphate kinase n=1 Tax=candidate division KSB3 bacterium TaxID=2044937 RepID=A0A2G6EAF3_9BACT|nr:MAG: polyphosphate kinase 1 [candidate division KSB3 bacterium]PIE30999.1 MAG: polyphosphate kinase 1 [candidate division KSB3 bacterium]